MLSIIFLSVKNKPLMLSFVMLNIVMLSVVMLNVMAPLLLQLRFIKEKKSRMANIVKLSQKISEWPTVNLRQPLNGLHWPLLTFLAFLIISTKV